MIKMHFFEKSNNSVIINALKQLLSIRETLSVWPRVSSGAL